MKFTINQQKLNESISIVQRAISSKAISKELEGVLLQIEGSKLKLTGTDAEIISIETYVDCQVIEEGSTLVNARLFGDIIRKLPNDDIEIEVKGDRMFIQVQKSNFELLTHNYKDYPSLPKLTDENSIIIDTGSLKRAIKQTSFAVSLDYNRRALTGVLFEVKNDQINFVALDGYRLAVYTDMSPSEKEYTAIVPAKALTELSRTISDEDENIRVCFSRNNIRFDLKDTTFYSQLIDGQFFKYDEIIRKDHVTTVKVNRHAFQQSLERAELLAKEEKANLVKLEIKNSMVRILSNTELGSVEEEVLADIDGTDQLIAFNSRYLLDGIKNMEDVEINLSLLDDVNPMIITGVDNDSYLYLVLPVRLA
ncbi:DNA polymerase III subunit beta [Neofamilia massiliensis]|uniref:DNA polymerase III subunit beta n=1 Tax=Neofamilia massiliensis TaxID=1673724 RepID=UPI0006BB5F30|nr:DNA polymerase III subunit beta [Neofamilia massiliensis]